jgi:nitrate reductase (cytochrome), electron transfer subunit
MRPATTHGIRLALPVFLLGSVVTAIAGVIVAVKRAPPARGPEPEPVAVAIVAPPAEPIAAEAQVFRTRPSMMAIEPESRRQRAAHVRTLQTWRYLRAYPGAPPRIPHGLTPDEYRTDACRTCHERGGYSERFAAYVPLTPHPEMGMCLQCHVGDDALTGIALRSSDPNSRCPQCHGSGGTPLSFDNSTLEWRTTAWPQIPRREPDLSPPPIPHELQSRGNCLPCHAGPAAVAEIRTTHPERADCRQCHVTPDAEAAEFTRPARDVVAGPGGVP